MDIPDGLKIFSILFLLAAIAALVRRDRRAARRREQVERERET